MATFDKAGGPFCFVETDFYHSNWSSQLQGKTAVYLVSNFDYAIKHWTVIDTPCNLGNNRGEPVCQVHLNSYDIGKKPLDGDRFIVDFSLL